MSRVELPPLPPCDVGIAGQIKFAHSDDAMRRYGEACARAALEAAAQACHDMGEVDEEHGAYNEADSCYDSAREQNFFKR